MLNGVLTIPLSGTDGGVSARGQQPPQTLSDARQRGLAAFVAGSENALAATAVSAVLDQSRQPSDVRTAVTWSPLLLHGPHASGKSHLARGVAAAWQAREASARIVCLTGSDFARQLSAAAQAGRLDAWRNELREVNLLVLEDLGELSQKDAAQLEFSQLLDALAENGALVIVTARWLPHHASGLIAPLRSRLSAALAVPLVHPAQRTRRAILEYLARGRNLPLSRRALDSLAASLAGGVPRLVSAIGELELAARLAGQAADESQISQYITSRGDHAEPKLSDIARLTARHFGLKVADLKSADRRRSLVTARCVAMHLARQLTRLSLGEIGKFFGGRDHTTVLHGCRRIETLVRQDRAVRQAVSEVRKLLVSG